MNQCSRYDGIFSAVECLARYKRGLDNPGDETESGGSRCLTCDTGTTLFSVWMQDFVVPASRKKDDKEEVMGSKQLCTCGCGRLQVKDGLAYKCYRKKHGSAPYDGAGKKIAGKRGGRPAVRPRPIEVGKPVRIPAGSLGGLPERGDTETAPVTVVVDFSRYPELLDQLFSLAEGEHRTADMQIIHILAGIFKDV